MAFPVDILATLSHEDVEHSAEDYMSDLLYSNPDQAERFSLPNSRQITLSISNVGFVPLYGSDLRHKVLALFSPEDQFTAVALYLADKWWAVEDILKTADPSREGILKVRSLGERIVLYVLNRIVYRSKEMSKNEVPFLCHSASDYAKILWKNGEAVGFYSVKPTGSLCNSFLTQRYHLPVMDSIFVRKIHRGNGYGLQILEDFVDCFKEDSLGLKYPISQAMLKVCGQYLNTYPADQELLWEVESVGGPFHRSRIASKLQSIGMRVTCHSGGDALLHENLAENNIAMEEQETMVVNKHLRADIEDTPVSTRTRSSDYRRKRIREEAEVTEDSLPDKITRVDDSATAKVENSEWKALEEEEQMASADDEGEEQPGPTDKEVEDGDKEERRPVNEEVVEPVAHETSPQDKETLTLEAERLAKAEAKHMNGEITNDFVEEEGESTGESSAMEENCTHEQDEGQRDVQMEEAVEDIVKDKDIGGTVPEEPEKQASAVDEEALCGEDAPAVEESLQAEQTSPAEEETLPAEEEQISSNDEALPAVEEEQTSQAKEAAIDEETTTTKEALPAEDKEQTSPEEEADVEQALPAEQGRTSSVEEAEVDEQTSTAAEASSSEEQTSPTKGETQSVKEDDPPVEVMSDPSSVEDTPVDPGEDTLDDQKAPELEQSAPEVADAAIVPDVEAEGMEQKKSTEAAPLEKVDSPSKPSPPVDKDTMDLSQDAVLLVGLKEVTYRLNGDNENPQTADEVEKMEEVLNGDEAEQGKETEEEKTEEEKATTTEEEDGETLELSSDDASEPPVVDRRVLRRKTKINQANPKRKSTRLNKSPAEDEQTAPSELEDESMEKEEEKATSTEEEVVEKSSDEVDETPVLDRRVLRRKTKVIQSPSKPRVKRRSKN